MAIKLYFGFTYDDYVKEFWQEYLPFFYNLIQDEGGYVPQDVARKCGDVGGTTKYGISLRFLQGLNIDDADFNNDGRIDEKDIVALTQDQASGLYFKFFFSPLYLQLTNVQLANRLFNFGVNSGKVKSVQLLQQAVNETIQAPILQIDGKFGADTLRACNAIAGQQKLYDNYVGIIREFYTALNKPQFMKGWLNRLARLMPQSLIDKFTTAKSSKVTK